MNLKNRLYLATVGGTIVTIIIGFLIGSFFANLTGTSAERIVSASTAVIQLDSFIVAGFIVGFFYLWERLETIWGKIRKKSFKEPLLIAIFAPIPVVFLVTSGLFAIRATLTGDLMSLAYAIYFLVFGLWLVFAAWSILQIILRGAERDN